MADRVGSLNSAGMSMGSACLFMRSCVVCLALLVGPLAASSSALEQTVRSLERPRVLLLTDYWKDPDEIQAMIRFLAYANEFEIEGLVATSLASGDGAVHPEWLVDLLGDYAKVYDNLRRHERPGFPFPSPDALKNSVTAGARMIRRYVGPGKGFPVPYPAGALDSRTCEPAARWLEPGMESDGAKQIIQAVDREDPRPVWIVVWGGAIDLAQAIAKVRRERSPEAVARFLGKIRLQQSNWQDTGTVWIWEKVPELYFVFTNVVRLGLNAEAPEGLRDEAWIRRHLLEGHGPLAARYPTVDPNKKGGLRVKEGDSPTFLYFLPPGLSDPEEPEWGGWGGRRRRLDPRRNVFVDGADRHPSSTDPVREMAWSLGRWAPAIANDFAARLDWQVKGPAEANHPPVVRVNGDASTRVLRRTVTSGDTVMLDATGSTDPDGHALSYQWWQYQEPGTLGEPLRLTDGDGILASFVAPVVTEPRTVHVILEVTDSGEPRLTRYRRLVFNLVPRSAVGLR